MAMLDSARYPILSRLIPITAIWIWPGLVAAWAVSLWLVPMQSSGLFGWNKPWLINGMVSLVFFSALMAMLAPHRQFVIARLIFLVTAGFVFLGRMSTFVVADTILATSGWRSRLIGFATYALASTGHVIITSVAVMIESNGGSGGRSTR